ncbi:FAD-binding protein [Aquirufa aurantiipilula]|uniref:FAD-binding protein n=1 Tax=Aquirufa aurantiipilula TaxID=2696561 RepID=UPI001CAA4B34|nr:FAD-binding protein [Aquirufa aurantiipilula]MBZ1325348.1 FAD-binding protein [Aquirufa aurantiipilula]
MNRQEFIKQSSILFMASQLHIPNTSETNWAGNLTYSAKKIVYPTSIEELRKEVLAAKQPKALGSKHSFNTIANSTDTLISTSKLDKLLSIDRQKMWVWVESGIKYGTLGLLLDKEGFALHNLASLPHISVAGACATATHGSGDKNGNLSSAVRGIELMKSDGTIERWEQGHPDFNGVVVNLGALGIVTKMALAIQPKFEVSQFVFENLSMNQLKDHFNEIYQEGYSVSMFTHWENKNINQLWIKKRSDAKNIHPVKEYFGATAATSHLHPIKINSPINCTDQMGISGPWYERLPHFKMGFTPSNGAELQAEYFVPRKFAYQAIMAVEAIHSIFVPYLFVTEIRSIAADELWLSPAYQQDMIAIHFTWKPDTKNVLAVLPKIEAALEPFEVKPHWGKLFTMSPKKLQARYPKFKDFQALAKRLDPQGRCRNEFLNRNL